MAKILARTFICPVTLGQMRSIPLCVPSIYIFLPSSTPNACIYKYFCAFVCIYMYTHLYKNTCIYASLHISSWALHSAYARVVGLGITSHSSAKNRHCLLGVNYMRCLQHARTSISSMNDWRGLKVLKIFSP